MKTELDKLPLNSRVWIYTLNKRINQVQKEELSNKMDQLLANWTRHGEDLKASYSLIENSILMIALDQDFNEPGGCSIDASVGILKKFGAKHSIDFFNRFLQLIQVNDLWEIKDIQQIEKLFQDGIINSNTLVYNNIAKDFSQWKNNPIEVNKAWFNKKLKLA